MASSASRLMPLIILMNGTNFSSHFLFLEVTSDACLAGSVDIQPEPLGMRYPPPFLGNTGATSYEATSSPA